MLDTLIREIQILTPEECGRARKSVHDLRPLWDEERYRLGAGISYYKPPVVYYATSKRMNPVLQDKFGWLYEKLVTAMEQAFECNVVFRDDLALPGFNIYCGPVDFETINYNIHVDLQFTDLNWEPMGSANLNSTVSFTLPIATPIHGTGLNIWNLTQKDVDEQDLDHSEFLSAERAVYQKYNLGFATIHDGKHYHQMTATAPWHSTDERITLQGHGLMQNGHLVLYG